MLSYAYFPGCASKAIEKEYTKATRKIMEVLGIKLIDIPEFSCCGAGVLREKNRDLNLALNARNFVFAEKKNLEIMTICSTCLGNLRRDFVILNKNESERIKANDTLAKIELEFKGKTDIKHLLWILLEDYGLDKIRLKIKNPLKNLKIAAFYGCHLLRPEKNVSGHQDELKPHMLEKLISLLGAIPVEIDGRTECCGFHITLINKKTAAKMSGGFLVNAKKEKVDAIVTTCPFCHMQFDAYQKESEKIYKEKFKIPVLHMSQMIGLALGIEPKALGLKRHVVKVKGLLKKIEIGGIE